MNKDTFSMDLDSMSYEQRIYELARLVSTFKPEAWHMTPRQKLLVQLNAPPFAYLSMVTAAQCYAARQAMFTREPEDELIRSLEVIMAYEAGIFPIPDLRPAMVIPETIVPEDFNRLEASIIETNEGLEEYYYKVPILYDSDEVRSVQDRLNHFGRDADMIIGDYIPVRPLTQYLFQGFPLNYAADGFYSWSTDRLEIEILTNCRSCQSMTCALMVTVNIEGEHQNVSAIFNQCEPLTAICQIAKWMVATFQLKDNRVSFLPIHYRDRMIGDWVMDKVSRHFLATVGWAYMIKDYQILRFMKYIYDKACQAETAIQYGRIRDMSVFCLNIFHVGKSKDAYREQVELYLLNRLKIVSENEIEWGKQYSFRISMFFIDREEERARHEEVRAYLVHMNNELGTYRGDRKVVAKINKTYRRHDYVRILDNDYEYYPDPPNVGVQGYDQLELEEEDIFCGYDRSA